jgi:class 3 adenylate cyclase
MGDSPPDVTELSGKRRRRLRAVFAADVANFSGLVSVDETNTLNSLWTTRRIAREELDSHGGWLFGMPGDGIFALFESAVDAVSCALDTQTRLAAAPKLDSMRLRIGLHLGDVLFQDELPFGEALVIAARLESLADPGGILVSAAVMEAVAPRISAAFCERGVFSLKHSPRRVTTFSVAATSPGTLNETLAMSELLDRTVLSVRPARAQAEIQPPPVPPLPAAPILIEERVVSLPKAAPLVVPAARDETAPSGRGEGREASPPSASRYGAPQLEACLPELTQALTRHLGPVAGVLVKRYSADLADPDDLIDALAREIPAKTERMQFLNRAHQVVARSRR